MLGIDIKQRKALAILLSLSLTMMTGCSSRASHSKTWPTNLNVISLSDGGICMDKESAKRLAEFKSYLEQL